MGNKIYYTKKATADMDGIWEYISDMLGNPRAADEVISKIHHSVHLLGDSPEMGTKLIRIYPEESPYRFLVSGNYMIFYWYQNQAVYIARVLYGKRNYIHLLMDE